jgi:hypothetical protein
MFFDNDARLLFARERTSVLANEMLAGSRRPRYAAERPAEANLAAPHVLLHFAQTIATERPRTSAASAGSE